MQPRWVIESFSTARRYWSPVGLLFLQLFFCFLLHASSPVCTIYLHHLDLRDVINMYSDILAFQF